MGLELGTHPALGPGANLSHQPPHLELIIRAEQESLLVVSGATQAVGA